MIGGKHWSRGGMVFSLITLLCPLHAQDVGFSKEFKVRLGYTPSPKDHLRAPYSGFGLNLGYGIGAGRIGLELGYTYKTGDPYITSPDSSRLPADALPMNGAKSVEDKRNQFSGFSIRTSFSRTLTEAWQWQAGLQFGGGFKHQYVGDAQSTPWDEGSGNAAWRDFYIGVPVEGGLNPSPYGGITWKADKDSSFEFNIVFQSYTALEYHHYVDSGSTYQTGAPGRRSTGTYPMDSLEKKHRFVPQAEVAYVFHF